MKKTLSILFAGASEYVQMASQKGINVTHTVSYHTSAVAFGSMLEGLGHRFTHIPSHRIHPDFPNSAKQLAVFDIVLIGNVGADTFLLDPNMTATGNRVPNLLAEIARYTEIGGGFGMVGGYLSFQGFEGKGNYRNTILADVLPVHMPAGDDRWEAPEGASVTCRAENHPALAGMPAEWPYILGYHKVTAKDGATALVFCNNDPLITVGQWGAGRTLSYATDVSMHWAPVAFTNWEHYAAHWDGLLGWLAG